MNPIRALALAIASSLPCFAGPHDADWNQVEKHLANDLPKSAMEILAKIDQEARTNKAWPEAIRATAQRLALDGRIQEGQNPVARINALNTELTTAPKEMLPLLETIQALWIWEFFQQHSWQFMQRTQTASPPGNDIQTWDLNRILTEVDNRFTTALTHRDSLRSIPISDFDFLIPKGTAPDTLRPTLYDFVAHETLAFYAAREQVTPASENTFTFAPDSPAFAPSPEFLTWNPATTDTASAKLKSIRLYQELLEFHRNNLDARTHADLMRLAWAKSAVTGEAPTKRLEERLNEIIQTTAGNELQSLARANLANLLIGQKRLVEAHATAIAGRDAFPNSPFAKFCTAAIETIERKQFDLATESIWNAAKPQFDLQYTNITQLHFRLYPARWQAPAPQQRNEESIRQLTASKPAHAWSTPLDPTPDFLPKSRSLDAPIHLPPGLYELVASANPEFTTQNNRIAITHVWISNLALTTRLNGNQSAGWVNDALTGEPIQFAKAELWTPDDRRQSWSVTATTTTKADGTFSFPNPHQGSGIIRISHKNDSITSSSFWNHESRTTPTSEIIHLFTDRAIYRPGQTIHFKGIAASYNREKNDYKTINDASFSVKFVDSNQKEIASIEVKSNAFGSFSGSFTAPTDRVLGQATLTCGKSSHRIQIEEYKRPKFFAEVGPAKSPPKLSQPVTVTAKATSYTGAPLNNAKVKWSVTRTALWPDWTRWCSWFIPRPSAAKQIAHGELTTQPDGSFEITFTAEPDLDINPKEEPIFSYEVKVDVTDTTGETRSASRTVKAAYTSIQANLTATPWQTSAKPVELTIATRSVDDQPAPTNGTVTIHRLIQPKTVIRPPANPPWSANPTPNDPANPNSWELGEVVQTNPFTTNPDGKTTTEVKLLPGEYRAILNTTDPSGNKVSALLPIRVTDPDASTFPVRIPYHFAPLSTRVLPGEEFIALWGTGYEHGRVWIEVEHRGKTLQAGWSDGSQTQQVLRFPVTESLRGGFQVRTLFIHENRTYHDSITVDVPWSQHDLSLKFESIRSKIEPGSKESWSVIIEGTGKNEVEMLGTLYDASLDAFLPHRWPSSLSQAFYRDPNFTRLQPSGGLTHFQPWEQDWNPFTSPTDPSYRHFVSGILTIDMHRNDSSIWRDDDGPFPGIMARGGFGLTGGVRSRGRMMLKAALADGMAMDAAAPIPMAAAAPAMEMEAAQAPLEAGAPPATPPNAQAPTDPAQVTTRTNLQETAFFEPHLLTSANGTVRMTFTMPEALTKWRFLGFAHDPKLRAGFLEGETVTHKDLMVQPNPPRFLREGDEIEFTVKVSNQSTHPQSGKARLTFTDAATLEPRDASLKLDSPEQAFTIPAGSSQTLSWRITVPDGTGFLTYKATAASGNRTDGEEGMLPVLSRRQLVTESITLPIRNAGDGTATERAFTLPKLLASTSSTTLQHQSLTVQVVSQPAWYAVMALPYLMEYPYECAEQIFNRAYANQLASHIANSDPKIRRIFELWKTTPNALDSPLLKNQDLNSLMIEETPWLRDANSESEARRNVAVLFDENRLTSESARAMQSLTEMQQESGAWPWFPGGPPSESITLYIVTGTGRLNHLGVKTDPTHALRALDWLDATIRESYQKIKPNQRNDDHYSPFIAMYLYGRSFFLNQRPIAGENKESVDYYLQQAAKYWMNQSSLMTRCHTALGLLRFGNTTTPNAIVNSLRENAVVSEELGMHWRTNTGYLWNQAPIETQAMIIETFREAAKDMKAVDDCQVWLLKQKQTQGWKTTKSTADAIYALLLGGDVKRLASDTLVRAELGGDEIQPHQTEPGTGFYERKFHTSAVKPEMGQIKLTKTDPGVSWGSLHWQYLEDISKITPHQDTPLEVRKSLHLKRTTASGQTLEPLNGPLHPGDELVTRIEIRTDRDMEYVHLKNQRASGTEPVNVLSGFKWQDGLGYYEMTRDTADHFFIERLPRGTYVFETSARVQLRGSYPSGIAEIQCMYAPEFNSHSASTHLTVQ